MQFLVHGVDRSTGQDATMPVNADNAAQAESIASLTMFVAEVKPDVSNPSPTMAYARATTGPTGLDWSAGIVRQVRILRGLSWVVAAIGALGVLLAGLAVLEQMFEFRGFEFLANVLGYLAPHVDPYGATWILITACGMRLAAHFMLGLRELLLRKIDHDS
jgi:hypothetical protein